MCCGVGVVDHKREKFDNKKNEIIRENEIQLNSPVLVVEHRLGTPQIKHKSKHARLHLLSSKDHQQTLSSANNL